MLMKRGWNGMAESQPYVVCLPFFPLPPAGSLESAGLNTPTQHATMDDDDKSQQAP